jgi:hypothetical protein
VAQAANRVTVSNVNELNEALTHAAAGDTILLRSGNYGSLAISSRRNTTDITLAADSGHTPRFITIAFNDSSHWSVRGVHVRPNSSAYKAVTLNGTHLTFADSFVSFADDTTDWTRDDWILRTANGIAIGGSHLIVTNNHISVVDHGISGNASHSLISGNTIDRFRGDGLRGLGDHNVWEYNTIKNCYKVDDNHDDGFQSWSVGPGGVGTGTVNNVVLRGNTFINYEDPDQPLRCTLQGIGMFDGTYVDWVIENNIIVSDHFNGITVLGGDNVKVINNTVIDANTTGPGPLWISINNHKNGTPSRNCVVRNNIATDFNIVGPGIVQDNNLKISFDNLAEHFVDAAAHNFQLKATSTAIDAGSALFAPAIDAAGIPRPQGSAVDIGAYEFTGNTHAAAGSRPDVLAH